MWPFKRGGLSSAVEINTFMLRFTLSSGLSRGVGLLSGWPLKRGSTVVKIYHWLSNRVWHIRLHVLLITSNNYFTPVQVFPLARFYTRLYIYIYVRHIFGFSNIHSEQKLSIRVETLREDTNSERAWTQPCAVGLIVSFLTYQELLVLRI